MESEWYWKSRGVTNGPISTSTLEELIKSKRLRDNDEVRLDGSEEWMPVAEVRLMFEADAAGDQEGTAAAASRALAEQRRAHLDGPGGGSTVGGSTFDATRWFLFPFRLIGVIFSGIGYLLSSIFDKIPGPGLLRDPFSSLREKVSSLLEVLADPFAWPWVQGLIRHKFVTLAVVALIVASWSIAEVVFADTHNQNSLSQLSAIGDQVLRQQGNLSADEKEKRLAEVAAIKQQLEIKSRNAPWNRTKYWTASGFRRATARGNLIKICEALEALLQSKADFWAMREAFTKQVGLASDLIAENKAASAGMSSLNPMVAGLVVVGGVTSGGLVFWWRRRSQR